MIHLEILCKKQSSLVNLLTHLISLYEKGACVFPILMFICKPLIFYLKYFFSYYNLQKIHL